MIPELPAIPTHDGVPIRDATPEDAARPGNNIAPLWPQPNETVWYRSGFMTRWSVGVCVEVTAAGVLVRQLGGRGETKLIFRERVDGAESMRRTAPPARLQTASAIEAQRQRGVQ